MTTQPATQFAQAAFAAAVAAIIEARGISDREAARQAGVAASTITRVIRQDHMPDVANLAKLADWAGLPVDAFIERRWPLAATPLVDDTRRLVAAIRASEDATQALRLLLDGTE